MQKQAKVSTLLVVLSASVLAGIGSVAWLSGGAAVNPTVLQLGVRQEFTYTNCSHVYSFTIDVVADSVYNITVTNKAGCDLMVKGYEWGYSAEFLYCAPGVMQEPYNEQFQFLASGIMWASTNKSYYFKAVENFKLRINIYSSSYSKNESMAWEALGGWIVVTDVSSVIMNKAPFAGWWNGTLDASLPFLYRRVEISTGGFYLFTLRSFVNTTSMKITKKNIAYAKQDSVFSMSDCDAYDDAVVQYSYLCVGIYYLKVSTTNTFINWSFSLILTEGYSMSPGGVPANMSMDVLSADIGSTWVGVVGIRITGIQHGTMYEWNVTCPQGYNLEVGLPFYWSGYDFRGENEAESGSFVLIKSGVPVLSRVKGIDVPNSVSAIVGHDWEYGSSLERDYELVTGLYDPCEMQQRGDLFDVVVYFWLYNTSVVMGTPDILFSLRESPVGVRELPPDTVASYEFEHDNRYDDEWVYKIPAGATGAVDEFKIGSMSDNMRLDVEFYSWWYYDFNDFGVLCEDGSQWYIDYWDWNLTTNPYWDQDHGIYRREAAVLTDTWLILQDETNHGAPADNMTSFSMWYNSTPAHAIGEEFTKECHQDLVLLRGTLICCDLITIEAVFGHVPMIGASSLPSPAPPVPRADGGEAITIKGGGPEGPVLSTASYIPVDGRTTGILLTPCRYVEYFVFFVMDTSNGYRNIGTFTTRKITGGTGAAAIYGYSGILLVGVSALAIAVIARKLKVKRK